MALRPCARPGCAALVQKGYCAAHVTFSARARSEAARVRGVSVKWYNSTRWQKRRAGYFAKHPFCVDPYAEHGSRLVQATDLDHVNPHGDDFEKFWNGELQGLCRSCHSRKTANEDGGFGRLSQVKAKG